VRVAYANGASIEYAYDATGNIVETITTPAVLPGPEITVLFGGAELVDGQATPIAIGTSVLGAPGPGQAFTVRNDGDLELSGLAVALPAGFALGEGLAPSLAAGGSDTFTVLLETTSTGSTSGDVSIASNDADENPFTFPVTRMVSAAAPLRYDFGTSDSPVAAGYTGVAHTASYSPATGFGWLSGAIGSRDRATGDALTRDFNSTQLGTFVVDVPNGTYDVVTTCGDATAAHDQMGIFLEGALTDTLTTAANEFLTRTYRVAVTDGRLTVLLDDLGGNDANVVINALVVRRTDVRPHRRLTL
jgi:hypothetical protein